MQSETQLNATTGAVQLFKLVPISVLDEVILVPFWFTLVNPN